MLLAAGAHAAFSIDEARSSRQLAVDAYCGPDPANILNHTFEQYAEGFVPTLTFNDNLTETFGYIGYLPSNDSIYVVFRGSSNISNWIANFDARQTYYDTWPECNCKVHEGFYIGMKNVYGDILPEVQRLQKQLPFASVKTTGHSLGAAQAQLCMMELLSDGIESTTTNFGSPRVGNAAYATFSKSMVPEQYRMTHYQDEVPHLPPTLPIPYHHVATEMYEIQDWSITQCDGSGEDPNCADQWGQLHRSGDDHMWYLDGYMSCGYTIGEPGPALFLN